MILINEKESFYKIDIFKIYTSITKMLNEVVKNTDNNLKEKMLQRYKFVWNYYFLFCFKDIYQS